MGNDDGDGGGCMVLFHFCHDLSTENSMSTKFTAIHILRTLEIERYPALPRV